MASNISLQSVIDYVTTNVRGANLADVLGVQNEPALSICNDVYQETLQKPLPGASISELRWNWARDSLLDNVSVSTGRCADKCDRKRTGQCRHNARERWRHPHCHGLQQWRGHKWNHGRSQVQLGTQRCGGNDGDTAQCRAMGCSCVDAHVRAQRFIHHCLDTHTNSFYLCVLGYGGNLRRTRHQRHWMGRAVRARGLGIDPHASAVLIAPQLRPLGFDGGLASCLSILKDRLRLSGHRGGHDTPAALGKTLVGSAAGGT